MATSDRDLIVRFLDPAHLALWIEDGEIAGTITMDEGLRETGMLRMWRNDDGLPFIDVYEVVGDDLLRPRSLEDPLEMTLALEDREVALGERFAAMEEDERDEGDDALADDYVPHVLILSSGDVTPFDLRVLRPADRSEVILDMAPTGDMEIRTGREGAS
jgi:hypothetical protein